MAALPHADVIVIGAGPAGLAAAAACADRGLRVSCVDPAPERLWPNTYGIWLDEAKPDLLPSSAYEASWPTAVVQTRPGRPITLERPYGRVDRQALKAHLIERLTAAGGQLLEARVAAVEPLDGPGEAGSAVRFADRPDLRTSLVVDASGPRPVAVKRERGDPGVQTAYGVLAEVEGDPTGGGHEMVLMDFTHDHLDEDGEAGPPSFLYAMRMPDGRWFLEETVLVSRPPWPIDQLRARLERRLESRGAKMTRVDDEERCFIPMGEPVPALDQPVVGFGVAASFVHPASGYQLGRALKSAPALAAAVADGLEEGLAGSLLARRAWQALWPPPRRRTRALHLFGMETLLGLSPDQTRDFFEAFFELPDPRWRGYLADTLTPSQVAMSMLELFGRVGVDLKWRLASGALGPNAALLWRGLVGKDPR